MSSQIKEAEKVRPEGYILRGTTSLYNLTDFIFSREGEPCFDDIDIKVISLLDEDFKTSVTPVYPVGEIHIPEVAEKILEEWAVSLNSPWSVTDETIELEYNAFDSYSSDMPPGETHRAGFIVVGYEAITSVVYGYGESWQTCLDSCLAWHKAVQEKYNPDDESF